jgi:SAM-dependent methyltransferase
LLKRSSPATLRNREPIRVALAPRLPASGLVLEIASGSGEHAVHFAAAFTGLEWQPTDVEETSIDSIRSWRAEAALPNLRAPLVLDVHHEPWPVAAADAIFCANMIHIAPWSAAEALFGGASRVLGNGGSLFTYGPYCFGGTFTAPSNAAFDESLRRRDPRWGVRDLDNLTRLAVEHGLTLEETVEMPANNHLLRFRRA